MALDRRCLMVLLAIPAAVELSTWTGVGGCGWPIFSSMVRRAVASFMLVKRPAVLDLTAEETAMTPVGVKMGPFMNLLSDFLMKKY